jgi:hypothetical protein
VDLDGDGLPGPAVGGLTLVAHPGILTPDALAVLAERPDVSLVSARDERAAAALVVRTVTDGVRGQRDDWVDLDAVERPRELLFPDGHSPAARRSLDLLSLRGNSRGCCVTFPDGVICGRDPDLGEDEAIPQQDPRQELSACSQGEGCFRRDLGPARRQPLREVDARVVLTDACQSLQVAGGQSPAEITMALAVLDGLAVAYVGCLWLRDSGRFAAPLLRALLRSGRSLGEAIRELNECAAADEASLGGFLLLGDGGLVPHPDGPAPVEHELRPGAHQVTWAGERHAVRIRAGRPITLPLQVRAQVKLAAVPRAANEVVVVADGDTPLAGPLSVEEAETDVGAVLSGRWIPAIRRLREAPLFGIGGIGARVSSLERQVKDLGAEWFQPIADLDLCREMAGQCARALADLEESVVRHEIERLASGFTYFADAWEGPYAFVDWTGGTCPVCGGRRFRRHRMAHRLLSDVMVGRSLCVYCGELELGRWDVVYEVEVRGPSRAIRGRPFTYEVVLRNRSPLPLSVALGACMGGEALSGIELRQVHRRDLPAGGDASLHLTGVFRSLASPADRIAARFVVCGGGALTYLRRNLWLRSASTGVSEPEEAV